MISTFAACVSAYASVGALIAGGKTERVFNNIAMIAGITAFVTGGLQMALADIATAAGAQIPSEAMYASSVAASGDVISDVRVINLPAITLSQSKTIEAATQAARFSITASGVGAGGSIINSIMMNVASQVGTTLGQANMPRFYKYMPSVQYRTTLNPGEIGFGFKKAGGFYHTGIEAKNFDGETVVIDFNKTSNANLVETAMGRDVPGEFTNSENYDFYIVVDNSPAKVNAAFKLSEKANGIKYLYNAYGNGKPFNCYEGRDYMSHELKIKNPFQWRSGR